MGCQSVRRHCLPIRQHRAQVAKALAELGPVRGRRLAVDADSPHAGAIRGDASTDLPAVTCGGSARRVDNLRSAISRDQIPCSAVWPQRRNAVTWDFSALGGTRTPNLLIRSQTLYPN